MYWHDDAVTSQDEPVLPANNSPQATQSSSAAVALLEAVYRDLAATSLPLALPDAEQARLVIRNSLAQLDDYILPRYRSLDAPLLAVVGGSTVPANPHS